jgi:hypothetical protein
MDPHLLDAYVAYAIDLLDFIEVCRKKREIALKLGDLRRVSFEERARNRHINSLERIFADVRRLRRRHAHFV